jgi:cytochrome c
MTKSIVMTVAALLTGGPASLAQISADADQRTAEIAFNNACRTCHTMKEGDNRLGPSLHGVIGRRSGSLSGYAYSESMKSAGIIWDETTLNRFMADPEAVVRGNKMKPYGGVTSPEERATIIAYIKASSR